MSAFKHTLLFMVMGLVGLAHAEQLAVWRVEGHITGIDASADPQYTSVWSRFVVGQDYVATFKVDLDALPNESNQFAYAADSSIEFEQAGLTYNLSFIGDGITVGAGGLDLGYGYGAMQGGSPDSPGIAHAWHFSGNIPSAPFGESPLRAANAAIQAGALSFDPVQFGFVDQSLGNLGTFIHASVEHVTTSVVLAARTSAVPEPSGAFLTLAGGLSCILMVATRRRKASHPPRADAAL